MPEGNGVPRWVEERFNTLDCANKEVNRRIENLGEKVDKLDEKVQSTRENLSNLLGRFAMISAAIGAATAALFTLIVKLIAG